MESKGNVGLILTIEELINASSDDKIINKLNEYINGIGYKKHRGDESAFNQKDAWEIEIQFLREQLAASSLDRNTYILLEYMLPGENSERPDAIVLFKKDVFSLEFKTRGRCIKSEYATQFLDYKKLLQEYHESCIDEKLKVHSNLIMCDCDKNNIEWEDGVEDKLESYDKEAIIGKDKFQDLISSMQGCEPMGYEEVVSWVNSKRARSKKIWDQGKAIKNALMETGTKCIYSKIKTIPYSDLQPAQDKINELIGNNEKKIIFVSGVPGAGKTLIGMLTLFGALGDKKNARYYTGNGALQNVLSKQLETSDISMFTSFRSEYIKNKKVCDEQVIIFDEAQRFWDKKTNTIRNQIECTDADGILNVDYAENVSIVCLIGNGQRPMSGEAGIEAWIEHLKLDHSWKVYAPSIHKQDFTGVNPTFCDELYLDVAKRQNSVDLSKWVEAVLEGDIEKAKKEFSVIPGAEFGIRLTRSLSRLYAKNQAGTCCLERCREKNREEGDDYLFGIFCSSKNKMEKMSQLTDGIIYQRWDSNSKKYVNNTYIDNREAYKWYSEKCCDTKDVQVATETFCQGLELDLPIIFFGGDLLFKKDGDKYKRIIDPSDYARRIYGDRIETIMEDTYRILLTRATGNMIIVIPETTDHRFDDTFNFFKDMGIKVY